MPPYQNITPPESVIENERRRLNYKTLSLSPPSKQSRRNSILELLCVWEGETKNYNPWKMLSSFTPKHQPRRGENSHDRSSLIFFYYHRTAICCWHFRNPCCSLDENVNFLIIWRRVVQGVCSLLPPHLKTQAGFLSQLDGYAPRLTEVNELSRKGRCSKASEIKSLSENRTQLLLLFFAIGRFSLDFGVKRARRSHYAMGNLGNLP